MRINDDKGEGPRLLPSFIQRLEWLRLCSLSVLLFVSSIHVPFIGVVIGLCAPAPIALIGLRQGFGKTALATALGTAVGYALYREAGAISFVLGVGLLGAAIAFAAKKLKEASEAIFLSIIASIVSKLMFMGVMVVLTGQNPFMFSEQGLREIMSSMPTGTDEVMDAMIKQLPLLIPSFLTLAAGLDAFVNYFLVSKICKRQAELLEAKQAESGGTQNLGALCPQIPPFEQWKLPRSILLAFMVSIFLPLFESESQLTLSVELNLKIIVNVLFFIQGLSFVWWWTLRKNFPRTVRFIILMLMLIPIFSMGIIALGIGDMWLNLRGRIGRVKK